jgi:hypothetical protein
MHPVLRQGDLIEFKQEPFSEIQFNDIILTYRNNMFVTHRVIYKKDTYAITRGDNNTDADPPITPDMILGKVLRFQRKGKWYDIHDVYASQSLVYAREIATVSRMLKKHKIPHVYIKGLVASLKFVKRFPQRIYSDIDLLIDRSDFPVVARVMEICGYTQINDAWLSFGKARGEKFEIDFGKRVDGTLVVFDIHLEPVFLMIRMQGMDYLYTDEARKRLGRHFINNRSSFMLLGTSVPVCSPVDQVLYMCLHIFHNNCTDSVRLQLVHEIIMRTHSPLFWRAMMKVIHSHKLESYVAPVFTLLHKYYSTPIPARFIQKLQPRGYKKFVIDTIIHRVNIFNNQSRVKGGILRFVLAFLLSPEPLHRKIAVLAHPTTIMSAGWIVYKRIKSAVFGLRSPRRTQY